MIKKLLSIIVLGLLLSGNAYANKIPDMKNSVWVIKDVKKYTLEFKPNGQCSYTYRDIFMRTQTDCQWSQNGNKIKITGNNNYWTRKLTVSGYNATGSFSNTMGRVVASSGNATYIENWLTASSNTSLSSKKNTCKDIGFSPNTDPFANCVLKLMEIEENKVNRASQAQIANTQRSIEQEIAKDGRDQEAWKFLLGMMGTNGATSSIGGLLSPSAVSCNKTGESTSGTNKICYYNCMGSTKTINVGSMQFCPININK